MAQKFPHLMSPLNLRGKTLRNRIVSTAHGTFLSTAGLPNDRIRAYHEARAAGGAGLIICEAASIHISGVGAGIYATAHTDDCIPGYRAIAEAVHAHGGTVFGQLYHPGRGDIAGTTDDGTIGVAYAPSAVPCERNQLMPRAMPLSLVREVISAYGDAARRMVSAGLEGIEIMAHHGHLVSQFLNPRTNRRTDAYGGSFENRLRFLREIIIDVRRRIGGDLPIGLRICGSEMDGGGLQQEDSVAICKATDALGEIDYFSVNAGSCSSFEGCIHVVPPMAFAPGYVAPFAAAIRKVVSVPVLVTGRINEPHTAERIIASGQADLCGMTRAMICDPELANKVQAGRIEDIRACIGCNQACIGHGAKGASISCIQFPESGRETMFLPRDQADVPRKVLVAGGGPAGMKAAVVAAERGHTVRLYERASRLGGQALLAQMLPGRAEFGGLVTNLQSELRRTGVTVVLNREVSREDIDKEAPDVVIIATGAQPYRPEIPGRDELSVVHAWDVVRGQTNVGASVVIADATLDWVALGVAEKLARSGCSVRLCSLGYIPGENIPFGVRDHWLGVLHSLGVQIMPLMRLGGCSAGAVFFEHATSRETVVQESVDTLVLSSGAIANTGLEQALTGYRGEVHVIGDCLAPRTAEEAVLEGLKAAAQL